MKPAAQEVRFGHRVRVALLDACAVLIAICAVLLWQAGSLGNMMPTVGTHGASLAAGIFFVSAANGLYVPSRPPTAWMQALRTLLALVASLTLTYGMFLLLPTDFAHRNAALSVAVLSVTLVLLRRAYVNYNATNSSAKIGRAHV